MDTTISSLHKHWPLIRSILHRHKFFLLPIVATVAFFYSWLKRFYQIRYWDQHATRRALQRDAEVAAIPTADTTGLTESDKEFLLNAPAVEILEKIRTRTYTSEQLVRFFLTVCKHAQKECNCISQVMFDSAIKRAKELDTILETTNTTVGPLHGLPISLKESILLEGTYATAGYAQKLHDPQNSTVALVEILQKAGAIMFVKTNVPQTLLLNESSNTIYGCTTNPWNKKRTCGGSTGGEAALIALGGSPIGIGTDIGGSVRIPSHYCGICALKPTIPRFTWLGFCNSPEETTVDTGIRSILPTWGPMGRCADDLEYLLRVTQEYQFPSDDAAVDPTIPPLKWNFNLYRSTHSLKIGYYVNDGFFEISRSCQRAVEEVVVVLRERGHTVEQFVPLNVQLGVELYLSLSSDGLKGISGKVFKERVDPTLSFFYNLFAVVPNSLQVAVFKFLKLLGKKRYASVGLSSVVNKTVPQLLKAHMELDNYRGQFLNQISSYDVIITPGSSTPAIRHGEGQLGVPLLQTTFLYNLLNLPAGIVPVTVVTEEDARHLRKVKDPFDSLGNSCDINSTGLPVGVQVVGKPFQEELVLRVMKEIEEVIQFPKKYEEEIQQIKNVRNI